MPHLDDAAQLTAALEAASHGWHVFPLRPGDKRPAITAWEERATTDPDRITRCWTHAPYNVGIATGPSGLVVVDLDTAKGPEDNPPADWAHPDIRDGMGVFFALCQLHEWDGYLVRCEPHDGFRELAPDTHVVKTPSGGTHLYFAAPEGEPLRNTAGKLGWKVDTRAEGGYVVGAGSIVKGHPYTTVRAAPVAPLPAWLTDLLRPAPLPPQRPITVALATRDRRTAFLNAAVNGELARVTDSGEHQHNHALYLASVALGQLVAGGELSEADVTGWLLSAALQVGQGEHEARRTIASGLRAGANRPRRVAA
ncbi:bifunctional DNA primase/polymerase [Streptomyces sp. HC44]|uniref:Bifunctional DNA primase/polymerase n=1 Tax=Streptomyces scabichelini TaxID=2711217 RepID=A0A6G4V5D3_9ACTN|nr:bifunctional DNA primase/polymerase [Streptomyces scabichelini]NGO09292.1 bifunctional DNA primase/polymerase [Streptomyces scabichelini]